MFTVFFLVGLLQAKVQTEQRPTSISVSTSTPVSVSMSPGWWAPNDPAGENKLVLVLAKMVRFALMQPEGESQYGQLCLQPVLDAVPVVRPSRTSVLKNKVKEKAEEVKTRVKQARKAKQTARQLRLFD